MSGPGFTRSDLCSIRAAVEQAERAIRVRGLLHADNYRLADNYPPVPPLRSVARALVEADFTLHHCHHHGPPCGLGEVCLTPVRAESGAGCDAIAVSWTTHDSLLDREWHVTCSRTYRLVSAVPGGVLHAPGYPDRQSGTGSACHVTGHRGQRTEAGR